MSYSKLQANSTSLNGGLTRGMTSKEGYINGLPIEILSSVFRLCMDEQVVVIPHPMDAPLVFLSVCRLWRTVALDMQCLWNRISPPLSMVEDIPLIRDMVSEWIRRSGSLPLHLALVDGSQSQDIEDFEEDELALWGDQMLGILVQHEDRWKSLTMTLDQVLLRQCDRHLSRSVDESSSDRSVLGKNLRSLSFSMISETNNDPDGTELEYTSFLTWVSSLPKLEELDADLPYLTEEETVPESLALIPLERLKKLSFQRLGMTFAEAVTIVKRSSSATHIGLCGGGYTSLEEDPTVTTAQNEPCTLDNLKKIQLQNLHCSLEVLRCFTFPNLTSLEIDSPGGPRDSPWLGKALVESLSRCRLPLEKITIKYAPASAREMLEVYRVIVQNRISVQILLEGWARGSKFLDRINDLKSGCGVDVDRDSFASASGSIGMPAFTISTDKHFLDEKGEIVSEGAYPGFYALGRGFLHDRHQLVKFEGGQFTYSEIYVKVFGRREGDYRAEKLSAEGMEVDDRFCYAEDALHRIQDQKLAFWRD